MEIWLTKEGDTDGTFKKDALWLPILPPSFLVSLDNLHQTVDVHTRGEVTILGKRGLKNLEFTSFFPAHDYSFAAHKKNKEPYDYIKKLLAWQNDPIRVTITGTNINDLMIFTSFSYGEPDSTGDIEYTLSLQEYRPPKYTKPVKKTTSAGKTAVRIGDGTLDTAQRSQKQVTQKVYTVTRGDSLPALAKKFYGSGSQGSKLYNANKSTIEAAAQKNGYACSAQNGVEGWRLFAGTRLVIPS